MCAIRRGVRSDVGARGLDPRMTVCVSRRWRYKVPSSQIGGGDLTIVGCVGCLTESVPLSNSCAFPANVTSWPVSEIAQSLRAPSVGALSGGTGDPPLGFAPGWYRSLAQQRRTRWMLVNASAGEKFPAQTVGIRSAAVRTCFGYGGNVPESSETSVGCVTGISSAPLPCR